MRALLFASTALVCTVLPSNAVDLKSLTQALSEEQSPAIISFALKRCSAVYLTLSSLMLIDGGDPELSQQASDASVRFFSMSSAHAAQNNLTFDVDGVSIVIGEMAGLYAEEAQANFAATGNRIEGVFREDLELCSGILDSWA